MFITPVSYVNSAYAPSVNQQSKINSQQNMLNPLMADTVSFSGNKLKLSPDELKNQLRILLSQNILNKRIEVRMPKSDLEKEVILEILEHRKNLEKYINIRDQRAKVLERSNELISEIEKNPQDMQARRAQKEAHDQFVALNKRLELEAKKRKISLDYFDRIDDLFDDYLDKKIIKNNMLSTTWDSIRKENINKQNWYSAQDLIDIISGKKRLDVREPEIAPARIVSKKQLKAAVEKAYTQYLRETVNIYMGTEHGTDAAKARLVMEEQFAPHIKRYIADRKELLPIYRKVENIFTQQTMLLGETDIYPIGEIWKDMDKGIVEMKELISVINATKDMLAKTPEDKKLQKALKTAQKKLAETKADWTGALTYSIDYEKVNKERFAAIGSSKPYEFLTAENKMINRYKELAKIAKENKGELPDDIWAQILA